MTSKRKQQVSALLKSIETGDEEAILVINPSKYIQHNPQTHKGREGLLALFKRLSKTSPRVNIVRIFSDGDYIFGHTEYDFSNRRVGFEIFRFEDDQIVEHWDNIQSRDGPNISGHSMVDGVVAVTDLTKTETNRELIKTFANDILIGHDIDNLPYFVDANAYIEHNPRLSDGLLALSKTFTTSIQGGESAFRYEKLHKVLAEGNFVLSVCEGFRGLHHTSFYDLYRIADGKIVEHWDTAEIIAPRSEWRNENGKF